MSAKEIDCRGLACPQPVIEAKKALDAGTEDAVTVIVDNLTARENVARFAGNAGCSVRVEEQQGSYRLLITRRAVSTPSIDSSRAGSTQSMVMDGAVYFISSNALGQGSPDLGEVLMKSLMVTLAQQPPRALLFLNAGVYLTVEGSDVLEQLEKMSAAGTEILVCGTCLDYYKLKDKLAVGVVSNMYEINSRLSGPNKVITVS